MPTFYFHVRDGARLIEDADGADLPDLEAARAKAMTAARVAVAQGIAAGRLVHGRSFEISDESGRVLAVVTSRDVAAPH